MKQTRYSAVTWCLLPAGLLLAAVCARAEPPAVDAAAPPAEAAYSDVVARMPQEPLCLIGRLITKGRPNGSNSTYEVQALLHLGAQPSLAQYTVRSESGLTLEQLTVHRYSAADVRYTYAKDAKDVEGGPDAKTASVPLDMDGCIRDTDISWTDLTLSFLWWEKAVLTGEGKAKSRNCLLFQVEPGGTKSNAAESLKVWIDKRHHMLLRAEQYDADGRLVKQLSVKSFKKIGDYWSIKDLEIKRPQLKQKTIVRIDQIRRVEK